MQFRRRPRCQWVSSRIRRIHIRRCYVPVMPRDPQRKLSFRTHGGRRKGAGRPPKGPRSSERHKTRPKLLRNDPVHVVARVEPDVGNLRCNAAYHALREASAMTAARRSTFRIVHFSIQGTHLHLICETTDRMALARGMQGFQISAARRINKAVSKVQKRVRHGRVFSDRYHAVALKSPKSVRNTVAYVLNNWRHHHEGRGARSRRWLLDPYSSAVSFDGWKEQPGKRFEPPDWHLRLSVWQPRTWLLREGWTKWGLVSVWEVPGPPAERGRRERVAAR